MNRNIIANRKLKYNLGKLCGDCMRRNAVNKCPCSNKIECSDYNLLITETVLKTYGSAELNKIPVSAYENGFIAHKYVGERINYSCVDYVYLPVDFFIKGLKAHGYSGELRKTKIVTI